MTPKVAISDIRKKKMSRFFSGGEGDKEFREIREFKEFKEFRELVGCF